MVRETISRRFAHRELMSANNGMGLFRRDARPESTSDYFAQKHVVRNFLNDMHQPLKKTLPRRPVTTGDMSPRGAGQKDFIDPKDPVNNRQVGYNKGHIRSLLDLDTYGPNNSREIMERREDGSLPASPNTDRFSTTDPPSPGSRTSSRGTLRSTSRSTVRSRTQRGDAGGQTLGRKTNMFDALSEKKVPVETLHEMYGEYTSNLNPRTKGREWFSGYKNGKLTKVTNRRTRQQHADYRRKMQNEAESVAANLDDFEARLRTIKRF